MIAGRTALAAFARIFSNTTSPPRWKAVGRAAPPFRPCARRAAWGEWLAALALGCLFASGPASAENNPQSSIIHLGGSEHGLGADLILVCPQDGAGEPLLQNTRSGRVFPISDASLRAVAAKSCGPGLEAAANDVRVKVTNGRAAAIYVAFTAGTIGHNAPGKIAWNCKVTNNQVEILPGHTCLALVPSNVGTSRFCAFVTRQTPPMANCFLAQRINQTMVETTFGDPSNDYCYPSSMGSCVWYDISVIPESCTDADWTANRCANTGGASYNLPVMLACNNEPTYICRGPTSSTYGSALYPSKCGNPEASCVPGSIPAPSCDNAYFHPTPVPSPNAECLAGSTLQITFLSGP